MKFYLCRTVEAGSARRHLIVRKDEAKKLDPNFEQIDIPTDQEGLKALVEGLWAEVDTLQDQILEGGEGLPDREETPAPTPVSAPNLPEQEADFEDEDPAKLNIEILEGQVSALGMAGADALDQFDGWAQICGISAAFSRGVHLLNVVAADDHQLAKVFLRDKLKKRKRFGA